jgi:membrane associated rhomboid family serine protease
VRVERSREPILNVPTVVVVVLVALCLIHAVRTLVLSDDANLVVLLTFGFIPERYADAAVMLALPGGWAAGIWSFVTYALLHADLVHLGFNAIWLLAFASPLARRFGPLRFVAFFIVTVAAGAVAHLVTHAGELVPMIGASAAISGTMGAATRFMFQPGGPLSGQQVDRTNAYRVRASPLLTALRNPRVLTFLAIWFGLNLLFGMGQISIAGQDQTVAWEAHVGGFLAGLFLFWAFDPVPQRSSAEHTLR